MAGRCIICGKADGACYHGDAPTGPRYAPISLKRTEVVAMATNENDWVFVDIDGNEVPEGDPASQTRYTREHFKSLDKAAVFGAAPVAPAPAKAETAPEVDEQPAKSAHAKK